jgi:anti-sigma-K factor RskA
MSDVEKKGRYHACENDEDAPGFKLWAKYETLNKKFDDMKTEQTKLMAVLGFWKWALPIIVAAVGAGAALGGLIVGHKAQASPAVDVAAEIQALRSEVLHMRQP